MSKKTNIAICLILFWGFRISASVSYDHRQCIVVNANRSTDEDTLHYFGPDPLTWVCRAKTGSLEYRNFMCHNLGAANTGADPFAPGWAINGGYWQWGRKEQASNGPGGPESYRANEGQPAVWNNLLSGTDWGDYGKMAGDPCPAGFSIPTRAEWAAVLENNSLTRVGSWLDIFTNYTSAIRIGNELLLPAAGYRYHSNGLLMLRGVAGLYASRSEDADGRAWYLFFSREVAYTLTDHKNTGGSVRCMELQGVVSAFSGNLATVTGKLAASVPASGTSVSLPYSSGNGGAYGSLSIPSAGVSGLVATLPAGSFNFGKGSLNFTVTGTPQSAGTAIFTVNAGGKTCQLDIPVSLPPCRAKISASETRNFMCHNLGASGTNAAPFSPGWEVNGAYWQWGRQSRLTSGPAGPAADQANAGAAAVWNNTPASDNSWTDGNKTVNDPCPGGFIVPSRTQWNAVLANNKLTSVGTWTAGSTNYSSGVRIGNELMLPASGIRMAESNGVLSTRGFSVKYWSSTGFNGSANSWHLDVPAGTGSGTTMLLDRRNGLPVRCMEHTGSIGAVNCAAVTLTGTFTAGSPAPASASLSIPYTGGNGGATGEISVPSTTVTGLVATLAPGSLAIGSGRLVFSIQGIPQATGKANFNIRVGGKSCNVSVTVIAASIGELRCDQAKVTGTLAAGLTASGATVSIPYTGGRGGIYVGQSVQSTGVTGLTASLTGGKLADGPGELVYNIAGKPSAAGTATFALSVGGKSCSASVPVSAQDCRAKINAKDFSSFMCHNLGVVNTGADPFTPGWEINGGYWQWGRQFQAAAAPSAPGPMQPEDGIQDTWLNIGASDGEWSDATKSTSDPCPPGYSVPTKAQWDAVLSNNTITDVGTWAASATNYSAGKRIGSSLMLPAAGRRSLSDGILTYRGSQGLYLSKTEKEAGMAWNLYFAKGEAFTTPVPRTTGASVRCIEHSGTAAVISCGEIKSSGGAVAGVPASELYLAVPYTGGNGGAFGTQIINSGGVEGLVATRRPGSYSTGDGILYYVVEGTPASEGVATFVFKNGSQTCSFDLVVGTGTVDSFYCEQAEVSGYLMYETETSMTIRIPYTGGNGGSYAAQKDISLYTEGIYAELAAGNFSKGSGSLPVKVYGTPVPSVTPGLRIQTGGKTCLVNLSLKQAGVEQINCEAARVNGTLVAGKPARGITVDIPYKGGNGGVYHGHIQNGKGVEGVIFSIGEGRYAGDGILRYTVSGTPERQGVVEFRAIHNGGTCRMSVNVAPASVARIECTDTRQSGMLVKGVEAKEVRIYVPYSGGNGGKPEQSAVLSGGVAGLTAKLETEILADGSGTLVYAISGKPAGAGKATFNINTGGNSCVLEIFVLNSPCRARTSSSEYVNFLCHNLGIANMGADPFTPGWEVNGSYWQWGRRESCAPGPAGADAGRANAAITGNWNTAWISDSEWDIPSGIPADPCPDGFSVPTKAQWDAIMANNTRTNRGTWSDSPFNYGAGTMIGSELMLPAAGARNSTDGALNMRGKKGVYMSRTRDGADKAWFLGLSETNAATESDNRSQGVSVRCMELPAAIGDLYCGSGETEGKIVAGQPAGEGVSASIFYTGGNGGSYPSATVNSTGVTGLVATLPAGRLASGFGYLTFRISGTAQSVGKAVFRIEMNGQFCLVSLDVNPPDQPDCKARISPTEFIPFMCHNLGVTNLLADPFSPGWELNGSYWRWGKKLPSADGPNGPGELNSNSDPVSGWWSNPPAPKGAWTDNSRSDNDPCPPGYRVPTRLQWKAVWENNSRTDVGSWGAGATNYGFGKKIGDYLFLPAAGYRELNSGKLEVRGINGAYWSSTESPSSAGWCYSVLFCNGANCGTYSTLIEKNFGLSVRCIAEKPTGIVNDLLCTKSTITGLPTVGEAAAGMMISIPYTGGNGGTYRAIKINSRLVRGLVAEAPAGTLASGSGSIQLKLSGIPLESGTAAFDLEIGGKKCAAGFFVAGRSCGARISPRMYQNFMCTNLGATADWTDPSGEEGWKSTGNYWQWGQKSQAAAGPKGPGTSEPNTNAAPVAGWNLAPAANDAWSDNSKTANDPCPEYYRIPSRTDWNNVLANNEVKNVGSWSNSASNYSSGKQIGNSLFLPSSGLRSNSDGSLNGRGESGNYWSSTAAGAGSSWYLSLGSNASGTFSTTRTAGMSVRCMKVNPPNTTTFGGHNMTDSPEVGAPFTSSGTAGIPYTNGQGESYAGQVVPSAGVGGLTAIITPGTLATGSGTIPIQIVGVPTSTGIAEFTFVFGGVPYTVPVSVGNGDNVNFIHSCSARKVTGQLVEKVESSGVTVKIPYSVSKSRAYSGRTVRSTGVTGLTATLPPGFINPGSGTLAIDITGTPQSFGYAYFDFSLLNSICSIQLYVESGKIEKFRCDEVKVSGSANRRTTVSGITITVPYEGGNGGFYHEFSEPSEGVSGLYAVLKAGQLANGEGVLTFSVEGTPMSAGVATFNLGRLIGPSCYVSLNVGQTTPPCVCRARISETEYRNFMCHNLGAADTGADPFTPGWAITGGYWFVGRKDPVAGGPSGPDASQANAGAVAGWSYNPGYWTGPFPGKDKSDPCPDGYRVPEFEEWEKILRYNVIKTAGTWSSDPVNYMAGIEIGSSLMLPAAGFRRIGNGTVGERGNGGFYMVQSSSFEMVVFYKHSYFYPLLSYFSGYYLDWQWRDAAGVSVRCIEE